MEAKYYRTRIVHAQVQRGPPEFVDPAQWELDKDKYIHAGYREDKSDRVRGKEQEECLILHRPHH